MSKKTRKYIDLALKLAEKSEYYHKIGCVVVNKSKIIGLGFNKPYKTHPKSNNEFKTIHSELSAILGLKKEELKGATVYLGRRHKNGKLALSKPCEHCMALLREVGIRKIIHTIEEGYEEFKII